MEQHQPDGHATDELAEVVEVIQTVDPSAHGIFDDSAGNQQSLHFTPLSSPPLKQPAPPSAPPARSPGRPDAPRITVQIREQPVNVRYRYKSEVRASSLHGASSTDASKTFPTIELIGADIGQLVDYVVVVSCVTQHPPYRPHPHNIIGDAACKYGVYQKPFAGGSRVVSFATLGIQCVKKREIEQSLAIRKEKNFDPFCTGFPVGTPFEMGVVRLCFQVFVRTARNPSKYVPLPPVVSEPVHDKRTSDSLIINSLSHASSSARGGQAMILLTERVRKEDISVQFYEENAGGQVVWSALGEFGESDVHKQVAISLRTPAYRDPNAPASVMCWLRLVNKRSEAIGPARAFEYYPEPIPEVKRKRARQNRDYMETMQSLATTQSMPAIESAAILPPFQSIISRPPFTITETLNTVDCSSTAPSLSEELREWNQVLESMRPPPAFSSADLLEIERLRFENL